MTDKSVLEFLAAVKKDAELRELVLGFSSGEEDRLSQLLADRGIEISADQLRALEVAPPQLTDDELEKVAGGYGTGDLCQPAAAKQPETKYWVYGTCV